MIPRLTGCVLSICTFLVMGLQASAQTQEKKFTNRLPVYVGDVINESNATLDADHAALLCTRLSMGVSALRSMNQQDKKSAETPKSIEEHSKNCIFHIVRFSDYTPAANSGSKAGKAQSASNDNWYVYSNDHVWSKEDLNSAKRLFGAKHVGFYFIFLNRTMGSADVTAVAVKDKLLTVTAKNSFQEGEVVKLSGFTGDADFLNGQTLVISSPTSTNFTASFNHSDYPSAAPSASSTSTNTSAIGKASAELTPPAPPTPDGTLSPVSSKGIDASCPAQLPVIPRAGADGYYASYTVDAKRKTSANVQHLFGLLGAEGLSSAQEISYNPAPEDVDKSNRLQGRTTSIEKEQPSILYQRYSTQYSRLKSHTRRNMVVQPETRTAASTSSLTLSQILLGADPNASSPQCFPADAMFGGGIVDVAYQPSDMTFTASLITGEGSDMSTVDLGQNKTYVVDNEGRYWIDFSVPLTLKKISEVQYQNTNGAFSPVNVDSANAFMAVDLFWPRVDVKTNNWTKWPHPLAGVAFAKQPLSKILLAGAWGPYFSELYAGVAFVKQPMVGGSSSCSASAATSTSTASTGYHYCAKFSIGLNLTVTGIASKLGSPK